MNDVALAGERSASLAKYLGWFTLAYIGALAIVAAISIGLDLNIGQAGSFVSLVVAGQVAGDRFGKDHGRRFRRGEKWLLALLCLIATYAVSAIAVFSVVAVFFPGELGSLAGLLSGAGATLMIGIVAILSLLQIGLIGWSLGAAAKGAAKKSNKIAETFE